MTSYETNTVINDYNAVTGYGPTQVASGWYTGASQYVGSGRGGQGFGVGGLGPNPPGWGGSGAEGRGGGGGGYFGGEVSWGKVGQSSNCGGGGGSRYVSGHVGCIAYNPISSSTWLVQINKGTPSQQYGIGELTTEVATHYSGRTFTSTGMTNIALQLYTDEPNLNGLPSPVESPFTGVGPLGAKNRDGILIIKYIP
jgi:hypothetical protein